MSHSRQTEHYELPLYDGGDIINPLTDFNNANETIDEAVYNANQRSVEAKTTAQEAKDIAQGYDARVAQAIETANNAMTLANNTQDMIAEDFNPTKEGGYKVGDFVIYNGVLYKFINAHTGAWDASDVQASPVLIEAIADTVDEGKQAIDEAVADAEEEIAGQTEKVTKTQAMIAQPFDENKTGGYKVDDVVTYADKLYKFTSAHSGAWTGLDVEQTSVVELKNTNKRVVVITDSYGDATFSPSPWIDTLETLLNLGSGNYYKYFEGSMGYVNAGVDGHTVQTLLASKSSLIANHNTITDIVFGLGINDITLVADVSDAIASLISYCKNNYVNAKIHFAFISNNSNKEGNNYLQDYLTLIADTQKAAQDNGAIFVQSAPYILHDNRLLNGVHPNANGGTAIAEFMCAYLKGLNPHVKFTQDFEDNYFIVKTAVDDGIVTVNFKLKEHSGLTMSLPANSEWHLINDQSLQGLAVKSASSDNPLIFFAHAYIDGGYKPIEFGIIQGKFYVRYRTNTAATWDWSYVPDVVNGVFATLEC